MTLTLSSISYLNLFSQCLGLNEIRSPFLCWHFSVASHSALFRCIRFCLSSVPRPYTDWASNFSEEMLSLDCSRGLNGQNSSSSSLSPPAPSGAPTPLYLGGIMWLLIPFLHSPEELGRAWNRGSASMQIQVWRLGVRRQFMGVYCMIVNIPSACFEGWSCLMQMSHCSPCPMNSWANAT